MLQFFLMRDTLHAGMAIITLDLYANVSKSDRPLDDMTKALQRSISRNNPLEDNGQSVYHAVFTWLSELSQTERIDAACQLEYVGHAIQEAAKQFSQWDE